MLCFSENVPFEDRFRPENIRDSKVCMNTCSKRQTCTKKRMPLLIEVLDVMVTNIEFGEKDGMYFATLEPYCIAPNAHENILINCDKVPPLTNVPCLNCGKDVLLVTSQKEHLMNSSFIQYNKFVFPYCNKECQENHIRKCKTAKSAAVGSLKNYEYALIINDADVSKRPTEKEVYISTGNITEQRVDCLRGKVISMKERYIKLLDKSIKAKYLEPIEIQDFIRSFKGKLKVSEGRIRVTASELIEFCWEAYPSEFSIEMKDKNCRVLVYIK